MTLACLQQALASRARHFSPFLVLGDPEPTLSVEIARAAVAAGATMLELGIAYRDPCADGPAVQRACARALRSGTTVDCALRTLAAIAAACPGVPLNLLAYGNLVHARGLGAFCTATAAAGASSLLVPDLPLGEDVPLRSACSAAGLGFVRLVGPRTTPQRLRASSDGAAMLYAAGVQGVTGTFGRARDERAQLLEAARATGRPLCTGFGIGSAADVEHAFAHGANVAIVGSQIADVVARSLPHGPGAIVDAVASAVRTLAAPTRSPTSSQSALPRSEA